MPRIANPLVQPLSQAFDTVARVLIGMPSVEERQMRASQSDLMQAQREKAITDNEMGRRQLGAIDGLAGAFENAIRTPQGPMPSGAPIDPTPHLQSIMPDVVRNAAALNPNGLNQIGSLLRTFYANAPGATKQLISNAMLGAGDSTASTPVGFDQSQAQDWRKAQLQSATSYGVAKLAADRAAAAQQAIAANQLASDERRMRRELVNVVGAGGPVAMTKEEYLRAGTPLPNTYGTMAQADPMTRPTLAPTGAQPSPGTIVQILGEDGRPERSAYANSPEVAQAMTQGKRVVPVQAQPAGMDAFSKLQAKSDYSSVVDAEDTLRVINELKPLLSDPTLFGVTGTIRGAVQTATGQMDALGQWLGGKTQEITTEINNDPRLRSLMPLFDPNLSKLDLLSNTLAYRLARLNNGPGNLSIPDVENQRRTLGLEGIFTSARSAQERIALAEKIVTDKMNAARNRQRMGAQPAAPAQAPVATGNTSAPTPPSGFRIVQ